MDGSKILVFTATKRAADQLTRALRAEGWPALVIHGDKKQQERDWVLAQFKSGKAPIMIATDVASRGIGKQPLSLSLSLSLSVCVKNVYAVPRAPARAVRPMRCT